MPILTEFRQNFETDREVLTAICMALKVPFYLKTLSLYVGNRRYHFDRDGYIIRICDFQDCKKYKFNVLGEIVDLDTIDADKVIQVK